MASLKAMQLLNRAARIYQAQKQALSKEEITKKINQIKYLSEQKNISRFTIKKEIMLLENQLQGIFELETQLRKRKKEESSKEVLLKKEIKVLKNQLAACGDKELPHKVDKLSHLLAEFLAKRGTAADVELSKKALEEIKVQVKLPQKDRKAIVSESSPSSTNLSLLCSRLDALKQEFELMKAMKKDPIKINQLENKIKVLEGKLDKFCPVGKIAVAAPPIEVKPEPVLISSPPEIKHDILFGAPVPISMPQFSGGAGLSLGGGLPLPPPPRYRRF
ncbi:hypothetical protein HZC30_04520 [Candidatus Woesearchaeota archaeon]|nr:hypothetical protein [Candidatus Woesearchaeota archaeon]